MRWDIEPAEYQYRRCSCWQESRDAVILLFRAVSPPNKCGNLTGFRVVRSAR